MATEPTAATLLAAAEDRVVPVWAEGCGAERGGVGMYVFEPSGEWCGALPSPAVALDLTVAALERGLPNDWRVVKDGPDEWQVERMHSYRDCTDEWVGEWEPVGEAHPTRAHALLELLTKLPKKDAQP